MKSYPLLLLILLITSCNTRIENKDVQTIFVNITELIRDESYGSVMALFSERTNDMMATTMLYIQLDKANRLLNRTKNIDTDNIEFTSDSYPEQSLFGEVDFVNARLVLDSIPFNQKYYKSLIEFKFVNEGGELKILALNVLDGYELIVVQRHLDNVNNGRTCKTDCPFGHRLPSDTLTENSISRDTMTIDESDAITAPDSWLNQ